MFPAFFQIFSHFGMFIQKFFPESLPPVIDQAGDLLFLSGQLFRKNRVVWSVISYVVIAFLTSLLGYGMLCSLSLLPEGLFIGFQENMESGAVLMAHMVLWMLILGQAVFFLLEMLPTHYILKRRLNLE